MSQAIRIVKPPKKLRKVSNLGANRPVQPDRAEQKTDIASCKEALAKSCNEDPCCMDKFTANEVQSSRK